MRGSTLTRLSTSGIIPSRCCVLNWRKSSTTKFTEVEAKMAQQICAFMQKVREMNFYKRPGVAETLDWASALIALNRKNLDDKTVVETMGCVFKYREDLHHLRDQVEGRQLNLDALLKASPEMVS